MNLDAHDDEPYQHKPMSPFAKALFGIGTAQAQEILTSVQRGSPEALAECQARTKAAIQRAQQIVDQEGGGE